MNKEIVNVDFDFTEPYTDSQGREVEAKIRLSVDVRSKSFNIMPNAVKKDFVFMNTSQHNWQLWIATAKAIQAATEFAVQYIEENTPALPEPEDDKDEKV
jgi:hypothetical protein